MSVDFGRLGASSSRGPLIDPAEIFASLPATFPYLRDVQGQVLRAWFVRRDEADLLIKMNTGGGKTLVALLCLQSCLNELKGPALYLAADRYLVTQARREALSQGFHVVSDPEDSDFTSSRAICITTAQRLFNGRSVFGLADTGIRRPIGAVVIDDAHACLNIIRSQFTASIPVTSSAFSELLNLFAAALSEQSHAKYLEIKHGDRAGLQLIPAWEWVARHREVVEILARYRNEDWLMWQWPLLKEDLHLCAVAIDATRIEISPPCIPIDRIPSFTSAGRRIYLSATLPDDSELVTLAAATASTIEHPITPATASDMGDRMILAPHEIIRGLLRDDLRDLITELARERNVVVIVPSHRRAEYWADVATRVLTADNLDEGVEALKNGHVGLVVFVNKYDGVDLPGTACEVLVIDGVPEAIGPLQRVTASQLAGTSVVVTDQMQRVEQGMGRAVRSNEDHCVVILADPVLAQLVYGSGSDRFGPATEAQLELSRELADMLAHSGLAGLRETISRFLGRDPTWISVSRARLASVKFPLTGTVTTLATVERKAFDLAHMGRAQEAVACLQAESDVLEDPKVRGWVKQRAASYASIYDIAQARQLQRSARQDNIALLKARDADVAYQRLSSVRNQSQTATSFLRNSYASQEELLIGFEALESRLAPDPDKTDDFEQATMELGYHLGFHSSRPERDTGRGPDVLWSLGDLKYLIIECKSGSEAVSIPRREAEQLVNSCLWFENEYDSSCNAIGVLVHPARILDSGAYVNSGSRIITFDSLASLREAVRELGRSLGSRSRIIEAEVADRLRELHLIGSSFADYWGQPARQS
jgi:hypothetical protein